MPPKAKYTREQMIDEAYGLVRERGERALTARGLAARLGTSTAPIFTAFSSIDEVSSEVRKKAERLYSEHVEAPMEGVPEFKSYGLKYIRFAKDEPQLFEMLFMCSDSEESPSHYFPQKYAYEEEVRESVEKNHGSNTQRARKIYNHMSVYAHGLAVMYVRGQCVFTDEDISRMLSEVFLALVKGEKI